MSSAEKEKQEKANKILSQAKRRDREEGKILVKLSAKLSLMVKPPYDLSLLKEKYKDKL